jgi:predicted hydrolase (HD superfamily)
MDRNEAWLLLCDYTHSDSLRKHGLCVEAAMRAYAAKMCEDDDQYGLTGLLHDFDYEKWPDEHPVKGQAILKQQGVSEDILTAIMGHAEYTGVARETLLAKTLYAVDELCGFLVAVALVRPDKSFSSIKVKSVKKKLKDKAFAAKVSRETIYQGAEELGVDFDEHILFVCAALSEIASDLGLNP